MIEGVFSLLILECGLINDLELKVALVLLLGLEEEIFLKVTKLVISLIDMPTQAFLNSLEPPINPA